MIFDGMGVATLKTGSDQFTSGLNGYVSGVSSTLDFTKASANYIVALYESNSTHYGIPDQLYMTAKALLTQNPNYGNVDTLTYLQASGQKLSESNTSISVDNCDRSWYRCSQCHSNADRNCRAIRTCPASSAERPHRKRKGKVLLHTGEQGQLEDIERAHRNNDQVQRRLLYR